MSYDTAALDKLLDRVKGKVFIGDNAAFLSTIMCSLEFRWTEEVPTAATDGLRLYWNPHWFQSLPEETRQTVLIHELWHPARLHMLRAGNRDPGIWNIACDHVINLDLEKENRSFKGTQPMKDLQYQGMCEEEIYDLLMQDPPPANSWSTGDGGDIRPLKDEEKRQVINNVVQAVQQARLCNQAGKLPGAIEQNLKEFLDPIIPWQSVLHKFFTDLMDNDYSWKRPNRRFQDMYLPSLLDDDNRLEHLRYYLDVSGSIKDKDVLRFNSEVKYIKDTYNPQKLTLVQFDTRIQDIQEFDESTPFNEIMVKGRGGTCLVDVREDIQKTKPTAAIIFTDMHVTPMEPLDYDIPIIWVCIGSKINGPFGQTIHID